MVYCCRTSFCRSTMLNSPAPTVGDVLENPVRYEGATLADPVEGIGYGRCKAKVMLRANGVPWIIRLPTVVPSTSFAMTPRRCVPR